MVTQDGLWMTAGGLLLLAGIAALAEYRRARRRNLDQPGWVPWTMIQVAALFAAAVIGALALKT